MGEMYVDSEHAARRMHLAIRPKRDCAAPGEPEDNPAATWPPLRGRAVKGAVGCLDDAGLRIGAIAEVEIMERQNASTVLVELEDDTITVRAARIGRSVETAVRALDEAATEYCAI